MLHVCCLQELLLPAACRPSCMLLGSNRVLIGDLRLHVGCGLIILFFLSRSGLGSTIPCRLRTLKMYRLLTLHGLLARAPWACSSLALFVLIDELGDSDMVEATSRDKVCR